LVPTDGCPGNSSHHRTESGATHFGIDSSLICVAPPDLVKGILATFGVVAAKLIKAFTCPW
jgi:hypothetical protein